ncbi:ABC transporter ATP-binding protein [Eubacterium ventriosum]|uniref:ABC transporter ATP-binding protein n=1 Tax=Eubacterium ventriosum TaxID=39496 RepID=UPI002E798298|nr:ABC transporter ATP-binding protein [Eubacterium ventriosum]MEE0853891.1 ABC transporter ATP-binding protein [Eubacterium ventriosum]
MLENLKKLVSYYKPYKKVFMADMFFAITASFIALLIPLVVRYVTAKVIYMPAEQVVKTMIIIAIVVGILILFQCYCNYYIANYGHVMGAKIEYDMRAEIFGHFQKLSFSFYDDEKVGQLMSRITSDLFDITELLHHGPENVTISVIKIIGALAILLSINVRLALIAFLLVPFMLVYAYFFNKKMKQAFRVNRIKIAEINAQIEDNLSGIRVVKSFANEDLENKKFKVGNDAFLEAKKNNYKYMGGYNSGLTAFTTMINLLVIVSGGLMITKDMISVTDLVTFLLYINIFTDPIKTLIDFTEQFQNGYSGYERFLQILSIEPEIKDSENAVSINNVKGDIKLEDVSFKYNDSSHRVLKHINLEVKAGSYVALVGSSGAGKTTLCNLIPRFYEATSGKITIDGKDIKDIKLKDLRDNIGIVQQDVYLFVGTVYDNIRYGRPDATREEVIAAAKEANAYNFIMSLPNGFETDIGQRGIKLSGGQKQRISIARVFLKNPPILIFDEATSALDNESEKIVQESMEKLAKNRTTMVIAHRLSTIRNAEKILVLTDKGIEEQGTHKELMDKHGIYYDLYNVIEK